MKYKRLCLRFSQGVGEGRVAVHSDWLSLRLRDLRLLPLCACRDVPVVRRARPKPTGTGAASTIYMGASTSTLPLGASTSTLPLGAGTIYVGASTSTIHVGASTSTLDGEGSSPWTVKLQ